MTTYETAKTNAESSMEKTSQSREEGEILQENIIDDALNRQGTRTAAGTGRAEIQAEIDLRTYEGYNKALSQLILEIDGCLKTANYIRGLNKSGKETLKTAREKLKQYKAIIKTKKRMIDHEFKVKDRLNNKKENAGLAKLEVTTSNTEIEELKNRRLQRKPKIEYDIEQGQMGKSSNTAPRPNESTEQIKKGNSVDKKHNTYNENLNKALQDAALLRIISNNQAQARELLQGIANNSLTEEQIRFCQANMTRLAPYFEQYGMTTQVHRCIQTRGGRYTTSVRTYENVNPETAYKTGGVVGRLNNVLMKGFPNAKPEQVGSITSIAVAAGGIYAIIKAGKRIFKKNEEGKHGNLRKAAAIGAGIHFIPALLTGQGGFSLIGDILSGKADFGELRYRISNSLRFLNKGDHEVYEQVTPGLLGMSIFPQTYTVRDVRAMQGQFSASDDAWRARYTSTYNRLNQDSTVLATEFQNTFNASRYNETEWNNFLTKIGVSDSTSADVIVFSEAARITDKRTALNSRMKQNGKKINPESKSEIDAYLASGAEFSAENLKENRFETNEEANYTNRPEDYTNREKFKNLVDSLRLDNDKKEELKREIQKFYDKRALQSKPKPDDFNLEMDGDDLILTSHFGKQSKINLTRKVIEGFGPGITFTDLSDLLDTADLANSIINIQHGKPIYEYPPFEYSNLPLIGGIVFNNKKTGSESLEKELTNVLTKGKIEKINTLRNHPEDFANYLSQRRIEDNTISIDSSQFPIVSSLASEGIIFTNEEEVSNLENRLNKIKEQYKTEPNTTTTPFSLKQTDWAVKGYILTFKDFEGNETNSENIIGKFPTIIKYKDKFLRYMNDPTNQMRGSV